MKQMFEKVRKLEKIQMCVERVPKEQKNKIIEDMQWLILQLREAWVREEKIK